MKCFPMCLAKRISLVFCFIFSVHNTTLNTVILYFTEGIQVTQFKSYNDDFFFHSSKIFTAGIVIWHIYEF